MTATEDPSPFGPATQKYWNRRREYFFRFDEGIRTDAEGLYSVMPEDAALNQASHLRSSRVIDAFAGIGGNAIGFARAGKEVIAIESNPGRLDMARHNAQVYGVGNRITFIDGDATVRLRDFEGGAVYLDPPWGGPDYKGQDPFLLSYFNPDGRELLKLSLPTFDEVALRVPRNFEVRELERFAPGWEIADDFSLGRLVSKTAYFGRNPLDQS